MLPPEGYTKASPGQSKHDYSLFVKVKGEQFTIVLVYMDDMLINCNSIVEIQTLKQSLDQQFTIKDLGLAKYFLGIKLYRTDTGTPLGDVGSYRRLVGRLLYLTMTRPDISYAVQPLSHFVSAPKDVHMQAAILIGLPVDDKEDSEGRYGVLYEVVWGSKTRGGGGFGLGGKVGKGREVEDGYGEV
nr:hypothetical protein [Tanacetum cinerariifolium]